MAEYRVNKVPVFGSSNLRKNWFLNLFPDSLHPFLKRIFSKDPNEWSRKENEQFEQAVARSEKLKGVEDRMGLLSPGLDEEIDDPSVGETEGMLAVRNDYQKFSPEVLIPGMVEDEGDSALDVIALDDKRREDDYFAGLLASEENLGMYDKSPYTLDKQDMLDIEGRFESPDNLLAGESGGKSKGLTPMQKYGAKLITDIFAEKEQRPPPTIGASPIIPGRSLDMSKYTTSRRKKDRYRNLGLLARGTV